jgi:hypothetical protein
MNDHTTSRGQHFTTYVTLEVPLLLMCDQSVTVVELLLAIVAPKHVLDVDSFSFLFSHHELQKKKRKKITRKKKESESVCNFGGMEGNKADETCFGLCVRVCVCVCVYEREGVRTGEEIGFRLYPACG